MNESKYIDIDKSSYASINSFISTLNIFDTFNDNGLKSFIKRLKEDSRKNVNKLAYKLENMRIKYEDELNRVKSLYEFDNSFGNYTYVAGIDEVGRGPLAGPIVAASVVLQTPNTDSDYILYLNDSKKLSPSKRESLFDEITSKALAFKIVEVDNINIDNRGIAFCNNEVFIRSYDGLSITPSLILSDGYPIKGRDVNNISVIKGDTKSASIAAASIIAKVYRDRLMSDFSKIYPQYGFEKNAGYGTKEHIDTIKKYGITPIHRKSFLKGILSL